MAGGLAFGLGGRDVAAEMMRNAYDAGQRNVGQAKRDAQLGRERAEREASRMEGRVTRGNCTAGAEPGSRRM